MKVEYLFDFGSPNCFLAHRVIPAIEARTGVSFDYVPILLGGVFKATGNRSPMEAYAGVPAKLDYQRVETRRFIAAHGIGDFRWNPDFPINTLALMRGAVFAREKPWYMDYVEAVFRHMWSAPKKMDDPQVIAAALAESGLPAEEIVAGAQDPAVKQGLVASTERAVARGVFGAPSFFVGDDLYFGKDRLRDVEEAVAAARG